MDRISREKKHLLLDCCLQIRFLSGLSQSLTAFPHIGIIEGRVNGGMHLSWMFMLACVSFSDCILKCWSDLM